MHEARFYEPLPDNRVLCTLCPHDCRIPDGGRGACAVRYNEGGKLYTLVYDKVVCREVDPIEKKPLFHFYPGSTSYSIATVGCNLRCAFCQNWQISQWPKEHLAKHVEPSGGEAPTEHVCPRLAELEAAIPGEPATPEDIVRAARVSGSRSIAYTYIEPTVFYELAYDTARLARAQGIKNVFVTNGFISETAVRELAPVLDAANVDLKFFKEDTYRRASRARLQPVLDAIRLYHELGVWVEVTTLVIPRLNDSQEELRDIAEFVHSVGPEVPWHVTQFYPAYKMWDRPPTPVPTLRRAREIGRSVGLRYVYEGNVPGEGGENTYCYQCEALLISRYGFYVRQNRIRDAGCPECGAVIDGIAMGAD
ncbi:MAG: AmmeMemoRadiSam system radical SAM enzyme [Gammaproteobacteria bacterium]|nr:AmmeMemoRadiSam system radical SAM enzyme [Gammaproteobacteria bacterium]NIR88944.1 AmmeMemoRadiSam system radical SAM enzyme [Gammaproteobacteria bacterium]NIU05233.1 AmmeMemoRadiSam system radical SAM enzyme [Gammaproteobacteria bacterium]NIV52848.1 AmmeMemoRadiSam system radical SAM enzyme [Gammaproteobacteria bacterium]NIW85144.1 AmmeMemoRadiSam system radical SAM enzyme [Gammaproteobacteria bacterium]